MPRGGARPRSGPPPKPRDDHLREGTFRRDRDQAERAGAVRAADGKRPKMPTGLSPAMKTAWKTLLDDLEASALLDSADSPLYEAFAVAHGRAREARTLIEKHGMLIEGSNGALVANPMLRVERESLTQLRYLADQLAIGIRTRAGLGLTVARGARGRASDTPDASAAPSSGGIGASPRLIGLAGGNS